jgi:uncharacterized protein with HEPN domain
MQHDDRASLLDILESARMILTYVAGKTWDDFKADTQCQDAVVRRFEIIREAVGRISEDFKTKYPDIPWREMKTMRNLVIHQYDSVDYSQVWNTAQQDLPALIAELGKILPNQY